jgi:hypothetical protein
MDQFSYIKNHLKEFFRKPARGAAKSRRLGNCRTRKDVFLEIVEQKKTHCRVKKDTKKTHKRRLLDVFFLIGH